MRPIPIAFAVVLLVATVLLWRRASREQRAIGVVLVLGFAVYGTGLVHPPSLEHVIEQIGTALGTWTYLLVGALAFLETGAFVGLVAPGEFTVILGGVVAGQGKIDIVVLIALVWACAVAGDLTSYVLGRRLGREFMLKHGPKVKITEQRLEQVEAFFARHGGATILIGRFIGLVRALAPFIAGTARLPLRRFLPYDIVAAGAWSATFCLLGYVFWNSFHQVVKIARQGSLAFGTVIVVIVGAIVAYRELRDPAKRERLQAWLDEQAEKPALRPLARVVRGLYRRLLRPIGHAVRGPALFVWNRLTPGDLGLELTTLLAIVLVGGFGFGALTGDAVAGHVPRADRWVHDLAIDLHTSAGVAVAKVLTALGSTVVVVPLMALTVMLLVLRRRWASALVIAAGGALAFLASPLAKALVDRPRPPDALIHAGGQSFPSGHAVHAVAYVVIAVVLAPLLPQRSHRIALVAAGIVIAVVVGLTRIYLRAHWLTDVLAGWGLSAAIFALCGIVALVVSYLRDNGSRP
jgi:membrane protein DedA with SNARE-associated domain/membrane-associated phospholipid phosphatase